MSEVAGRVFDLLEQVVIADHPLGLIDLATKASLDKSTASRMLRFLTERQLVIRSEETQRYDVGPALLTLAASAMKRSHLHVVAQAHLVGLRDSTGETVSLHLRIGNERVCMYGVESTKDIRSAITPGERRPLFLGASGKAILAYVSPTDVQKVMRLAKAAAVDVAALSAELRKIRQQQGLCAISTRIPGLGALAVPLFDPGGVIGSMTIAGPVERWTMKRMRVFLDEARLASRRISLALGGSVP